MNASEIKQHLQSHGVAEIHTIQVNWEHEVPGAFSRESTTLTQGVAVGAGVGLVQFVIQRWNDSGNAQVYLAPQG